MTDIRSLKTNKNKKQNQKLNKIKTNRQKKKKDQRKEI